MVRPWGRLFWTPKASSLSWNEMPVGQALIAARVQPGKEPPSNPKPAREKLYRT